MADKNFGVKQINLIGSSGTPTLTSPNNLNLNAVTVAISTDVTIGGQIMSDAIVGSGYSVGIGSTMPTSSLDVVGDIKATGIVTASGGFSNGSAPISFTVNGSNLTISVSGIGSTTLTLA